MTKNPSIKLAVKPLTDLVIGSLGDVAGDIGMVRRRLSMISNQTEWTEQEMNSLKAALEHVAGFCRKTVAEWEEESGVKLP